MEIDKNLQEKIYQASKSDYNQSISYSSYIDNSINEKNPKKNLKLLNTKNINDIFSDFYKNSESRDYEYDLLLENNLIDPSIIYGIKYSSFRLDLAFKTLMHRFIIIGTKEGKLTDFLNSLFKNFDLFFGFFSKNFYELKNIFLILRFVNKIPKKKDFINSSTTISSEKNPTVILETEKSEISSDNLEIIPKPKLFKSKIIKLCGINFDKSTQIAEGYENISTKLKSLDENLNLFNLEYENLSEKQNYFEENSNTFTYEFDYFSNEKKISNLEELIYILEIPEDDIRINILNEKIFNSEIFIFPVLNLENYKRKSFDFTNLNFRPKNFKNLQINHYDFLKKFLECDFESIQFNIEKNKKEIKEKINTICKLDWTEDPYFKNNLGKKLHKKNILINLISSKNIFSENLKKINSPSLIEIDKVIYNYFIINDIENIHSNEIIKFSESEYFVDLFEEDFENEINIGNYHIDKGSNYVSSNNLDKNSKMIYDFNTSVGNTYRECVQIVDFLKDEKNDKINFTTNNNQEISSLYKKNNLKNYFFNEKISELCQKFILNIVKKLSSKIFSHSDKNQKILFFSTQYNLIFLEFNQILKDLDNISYTNSFQSNIFPENQNLLYKTNPSEFEEKFNLLDSFDNSNNNSPYKIKYSRNTVHIPHKSLPYNTSLFSLIQKSNFFQRLFMENPENFIFKNFEDFKKNKLDFMIKKSENYQKFCIETNKIFSDPQNSYQNSEINHFYSNYSRYTTIINDLLLVCANVFSNYDISDINQLNQTLLIYTEIISSFKKQFDVQILEYRDMFYIELEDFFSENLQKINEYKISITFFTISKINEMEKKFLNLIEKLKTKIDVFINEIAERNIVLIIGIKNKLIEKGYLNDFIANYLINIQYSINLKSLDFDYYYDDIAQEILVKLSKSGGLGIAGGIVGFGLSRVLSVITANAISGSVAGPAGTIAGTAVGFISLLGSSYSYFSNNKSKYNKKFEELFIKTNFFFELLKEKLKDFYDKNNEEINTRLKKILSYIEFTLRKYLENRS